MPSHILTFLGLESTDTSANILQEGHNLQPNLDWQNVAIASSFIVLNGVMSLILGLRLEKSLIVASIRCLVQLTVMGYILEDVFKARHPAIIMLMVCILILLGAYETVYNKCRLSFPGMFMAVLLSTAFSTLLIGIIGTRYTLEQVPFWIPETFIPTMGMLLGNMMSGMAVALSSVLTSVGTGKEQIETYLAFGASRWEAGQSITVEAVRLAMLPTINQMSVIGLISIPGMMTGQILGGAPIMGAVRYQQIIMFLISASTALGVLMAVVACVRVMIDNKHRLRPEKIIHGKSNVFRDLRNLIVSLAQLVCCIRKHEEDDNDSVEERRPLLD
ncbi:upf0014-domain-containing protein [Lichtheimia corymbifera JMRC:FSU:9682]|uniref:Upf0014-domain-containing protein n=1 Tax=Lichtheimia corymbifera JMRC:FSU:9682 TaxID=1263082 RepID=A0A068RVA4_9FUNG|nr:upf0014-domain-containing protein [Lichtheimia corymbifera JMRC:FSU:9682]